MKNRKMNWAAALIAGVALLSAPVFAMENHAGHDMAEMKDDSKLKPKGMGHDQSGMIMLGEEVQNGVKAMFHLMPIDSKDMPTGNESTHHLMVILADVETGKLVEGGTVAVKVTSPAGKESSPLRLTGMQGHFGADVTLDQPGIWHFRVATKLTDGKVRHYHSHHVVKS